MPQKRLALSPWFILKMKDSREIAIYKQDAFESRCYRWHHRHQFLRQLPPPGDCAQMALDVATQACARCLRDVLDLQEREPFRVGRREHGARQRMFGATFEASHIVQGPRTL